MTLDLETLETSFDLIAPRGEELVDTFYTRLFDAAPAVEPLFAHTNLRKQRAMLLATLVLLRKSLRDLDSIAPKLRQLGARQSPTAPAPSTTRWSPRCCSPRWPSSPGRPGRLRSKRRGRARSG